jgi:signal transduction histidine kinase/CHASE3 domain sensor protein
MTIRARLWVGFGLMMAAILGLAALGLAALVVVDREYSFLLDVRHQRVAGALRLKAATQSEILSARSYLLTEDPAFLSAVEQADAEQARAFQRLRELANTDAEHARLDELEAGAVAYDQLSGDDTDQSGRQVSGESMAFGGEDARRELTALIDRYIDEQQSALDATSAEVTRVVVGVGAALTAGAALALVLAAAAAWKTAADIVVPLSGLVAATRALQGGQEEEPPLPSSADEIGQLGSAFGEMRQAVAERERALAAERARAESILRSLAEGLCLLDRNLRIVYVNPSLGFHVGQVPSDLVGRTIGAVLDDLSVLAVTPERLRRPILRAIYRADRRVPPVDLDLVGGRCLRLTTFPVRGLDGVTIGQGLLLRDVTAEREREQLHTTFLKLVSHELRTPLGAIKGCTSALRQKDLPLDEATRQELLGAVEAGADRLARIVGEILDLSRIEAGAVQLQREPCLARELLDATLADLGDHLGADTRVRLALPRGLPPVQADPLLTRQVLRSLLDNALRYSGDGSTVMVTATQEGQRLALRITDTGPGLTEADQDRIFEPFYRGGRVESDGLGLGLPICRGLIRAQGGNIWIESALGRGTTAWVTLPLAAVGALVGSSR